MSPGWLKDESRMTPGWLQDDSRMTPEWLQDDSRLVSRQSSVVSCQLLVVSCQLSVVSQSFSEWCCMMLNDAESLLLIKQEPHDRSVLFLYIYLKYHSKRTLLSLNFPLLPELRTHSPACPQSGAIMKLIFIDGVSVGYFFPELLLWRDVTNMTWLI